MAISPLQEEKVTMTLDAGVKVTIVGVESEDTNIIPIVYGNVAVAGTDDRIEIYYVDRILTNKHYASFLDSGGNQMFSSQQDALNWFSTNFFSDAPVPPGGVTSFNGRTGAVVPQSGDYSLAQITGGSNAILQGGNSFGTGMSIGTNDSNTVRIRINGADRWGFSSSNLSNQADPTWFTLFNGASTTPASITRNTATTYPVFAFNNANASSTGNILDFQNQGTTLSYITNIGDFFSNKNSALSIGTQNSQPIIFVANGINQLAIDANRRIYSGAGANYGSITFGTASTTSNLLRNTADNFSVFAFNNANGSSTGHTVDFQNQGNTRSFIGNDGSFTLDNTASANGITLFNTADQTTNYEFFRISWNSNEATFFTGRAGTGTYRDLVFSNQAGYKFKLSANGGLGGVLNLNTYWGANVPGSEIGITSVFGNSSGTHNGFSFLKTINQSGTAGYRGFWISPYEQALGTGPHLLIDAGLNTAANGSGTHTSKFSVDNNGIVSISNIIKLAIATNSSPSDGDIWREDNTNTGLKIRINGVTKTITVS